MNKDNNNMRMSEKGGTSEWKIGNSLTLGGWVNIFCLIQVRIQEILTPVFLADVEIV